MNNLYVVIGVPGSGKDYYINKHKKHGDVVLSSDDIRAKLGDVNDQTKNEQVFSMLYRSMNRSLRMGKDVWFNATNVNKRSRALGIKIGHQHNCNVVAVVMDTPIDVCIQRDASRERTVGKNVIDKFVHRFEMPTQQEGFDDIRIIKTDIPEAVNEPENIDGEDRQFGKN